MKQYGFPSRNRLTSNEQYRVVRQVGKYVGSECLIAYCHPNEVGQFRLGVSVNKKFGNAPQRNRFKRWLREIFRLERPALVGGLDLLVMPRRGSKLASFTEYKRDFLDILQKTQLFLPGSPL